MALLRLQRRITMTTFLPLLVIVLLFEFLTSIEFFATTAIFGACALALSWAIWRVTTIASDIRRVTIEIGCAYLATAVLAAPYLYYIFARGVPGPINSNSVYSNDLLAFAVPTRVLYAGRTLGKLLDTSGVRESKREDTWGPDSG